MLTSKQFEIFRKETERSLQELANKYNVNIKARNIKYTNNSFNLNLEVSKKEINGKSYEQVEFENYCVLYNFKPEDYKRDFSMNGETYTITGFKPRATKLPVIAVNSEGKSYKFNAQTVKKLMTI